jgi:transposase InsO family protein
MKWTYYYLYVILDIFSRYVVGWMVAERESATLAERLITASCAKQEIPAGQLTIHADRGTAMTAKSVALLLADLGVTQLPDGLALHAALMQGKHTLAPRLDERLFTRRALGRCGREQARQRGRVGQRAAVQDARGSREQPRYMLVASRQPTEARGPAPLRLFDRGQRPTPCPVHNPIHVSHLNSLSLLPPPLNR